MSTQLATPNDVTTVVDDPNKPVKAIVATIIGVLLVALPVVRTLLGDGWSIDDTIVVVLAVLGPIGVYFAENPKVTA